MSIYEDEFESADAALDAIKSSIEERNGKFIVGGDLRKAFDNAGSNASESKKYRERAQKAERESREYQEKLAAKEAEIEELEKLDPRESQKQLQEYAREKAALARQLDAATKSVVPLQEQIAKYQAAERDTKIVSALRDEATRLGIRPEALRDVERLKSSFQFDSENGSIFDAEGRDVAAALAAELKASPHWLPTSQGGGSTGGAVAKTDAESKRAAFDAAEKNGDFLTMISATLQ